MDLSQVSIQDVAPLMAELERVLATSRCKTVTFEGDKAGDKAITLSRGQAERLLVALEKRYFATVH